MAIKLPQGFDILSKAPIDVRLVLTKTQMKDVGETLIKVMPEKYFAVCKDDGQFYIYDKLGEYSSETGYFHAIGLKIDPGAEGQILLFTAGEWTPVNFADNSSIIYLTDEGLSIKGYKEAEQGQILAKGDTESGLDWIDPFNIVPGEEGQMLIYKDGKWTSVAFVDKAAVDYLTGKGITLKGYSTATQGQVPSKAANGNLAWIDPFNIEGGEEGQILIYKNSKWTPSKFTDENSIIYLSNDGGLSIKGYESATQGQMLVKDTAEGLAWVNPVTDEQIRGYVEEARGYATQAGTYATASGNSAIEADTHAKTAQRINEVTVE